MQGISIESISCGVSIPCQCGKGRIAKIESAGRDYKVWCACGVRYFVTTTGKVFKSGANKGGGP